MYYPFPYHTFSTYIPGYEPGMRIENMSGNNNMMMPNGMPNGNMDPMMEMMRQHMQLTNEIKRKVDSIDERLRRMEQSMMR